MPISLYMDQHVPGPTTTALGLRGVDVITAFEDGRGTLPDPELLDRATQLGRVLFTQDRHFLIEATRRQREGISFVGVV
jgi:predicted nuclease of predicted toxin-antitoxin system